MLTPDISLPTWLPRGQETVITLVVREGASVVTPSAGTFELRSPSGVVVHSQAIEVVVDSAGATVPELMTPLGVGWLEVWRLVLGGQPYEFVREAALVLRPLHPVLQDSDLTSLQPALGSRLRALGQSSYTWHRQEAWRQLVVRLMEDGRYPWLILSAHALRTVHLHLTLHLLYDAAGGEYREQALDYLERFEAAWKRLSFTYDTNADDVPGESERGVVVRASRAIGQTTTGRGIWRPE